MVCSSSWSSVGKKSYFVDDIFNIKAITAEKIYNFKLKLFDSVPVLLIKYTVCTIYISNLQKPKGKVFKLAIFNPKHEKTILVLACGLMPRLSCKQSQISTLHKFDWVF
jgi:hypothetical protein